MAGCAESKVAIDTAKVITRDGPEKPMPYKVGKPYQVNGAWYYPKVDYDYNETGIASWYGPGFHGGKTANGEIYDENALTAAHKTLPLPTMVQVTNLENGRSIAVRINDRGPFSNGRIIDMTRRGAQLLGFLNQGTARVRVEVLKQESQQLAALSSAQGGDDVAPKPQAAPAGNVVAGGLPAIEGAKGSTATAPQPQPGAKPVSALGQVQAPEPTGEVTIKPVRATNIFIQAGAFLQQNNAQQLSGKLRQFGNVNVSPVLVGQQRFYRVRLGPLASVDAADETLLKVIQSGHPEARIVVD